ncbi:MAG: 50S ribosomal protein L4 [Pseudomonadota bacterium]|nr:50S ribosomal protein L4 [Gammaproteobacteria bacterium]MDQ3582024.1 50S ribosomal protein L4 [Pseudomonadota bacterium]
MQIALRSGDSGAEAGSLSVSDAVFAAPYNEPLVHQVVTAYLAGGRAGTKAQKTRADVRGGGAKPWRQKSTGRARAGTIRGPLWRGGGVTFAARPRNYAQKVNRKMYGMAMRSILSELVRQGRLTVVDALAVSEPRTKGLVVRLSALGLTRVLILTESFEANLHLASRNLFAVDIRLAGAVDPVSLVGHESVLITEQGLRTLEARLA